MKKHVDVAIVGGGIIGSSIAFFAARAGLSVILLEEKTIGSGTTKAAAGMLGAHSENIGDIHFHCLAKESQNLYKMIRPEVEHLSGLSFEHGSSGILQYPSTSNTSIATNGIHKTAEYIRKVLPTVNIPDTGGYLFSEDVHVHPFKTCLSFSKAALALGAEIWEHTPVKRIAEGTIETEDFAINAEHIVIAAGHHSQAFLPLQMTTVKGQCMRIQAKDIELPFTLFNDGKYMLQREDGSLVVGATMEKSDAEGITMGAWEELANIAEGFLHGSSHFPVLDLWYGFRPKTVDDLPYIGKVSNHPNMYVAAGHFRNGILLAPATANFILNLILGKDILKEWISTFDPARGLAVKT